jgi:HAE1 family hydrophobic/amphiphilic exporter-1
MVVLAAVVFGYFSLGRLPVNLMPELTYPTLTVRTEYPGSAPEEVENDLSRPLEEALGIIGGLRRISSVSRAGVSDVVLEFTWDTDISDATQNVLERLDLVFLPEEAQRPLILHYDPSLDPIMDLSLSGEGARFEGEAGLRRVRRIAELQVKRALEPVKGVAAVRVKGGLEEEIHILVDEEQLRRTGISIQQVIQRLGQENINVAGGTIQEGRIEYLVRTLNEYQDLEQIRETIVTSFEGREVRIGDLARVETSHKEREILTRTDGRESVQIEIYKEADANIVAVAERIEALLGELPPPEEEVQAAEPDAEKDARAEGGGPRAPPGAGGLSPRLLEEEGVRLEVVADRSLFIESSIREVRNTAILGGLLAVLILYLFLRRFVPTLIIALSIPISILVTFAPLHLLGVSLNIMSLGGLALGIGMLVDSSIVVLESIYRCRDEGDGVAESSVRGTREVRSAVLASTLTSIAVFFPMVFVEGVAGQAFGDLGMAVVVSLLAAAVVALFFIPMLASLRCKRAGPREERGGTWSFPAWGLFREDLRAPRGWFGILLFPFRRRRPAPRFVLLLALWVPTVIPLALLTGGAALLWWVYSVIRLALATLLWVAGGLLKGGVWGLLQVLIRLLFPALRVVFGALTYLPLVVTGRLLDWLQRAYPPLLRWSLGHPLAVTLVVLVCLWGSWQMVSRLDSELLPEVHQGEFTVEVALPVGTPLEQTEAILAPVEAVILEEKSRIHSLLLTVGYDATESRRSDEGEHTARFKILLAEGHRGALREREVIESLRRRFAEIPDLEARVTRPVLFSSKTPIEVEVHGQDLLELRRYGQRVEEVLARLPGLADVETTLRSGAPEVQVVYDRDRLSRYGLNIGEVARLVRDKVQGYEATRFNLIERRIPIVVRLDLDDRETVEDVRGIIVNPGGERPIPLSAVAEVSLGEGPSEVRRIDGRRVAVVRANLAGGALSGMAERITEELRAGIDWPTGMTFYITGQNEEWERSRGSLWLALGLSIFLVYVIMAAQFESLVHPLVIMVSIPLAFIGTVAALYALNLTLSVVVYLGMIMLAGIVVNNAIVLVDYINRLRRRGLVREEAIVTAGSVRLRPILMTTATTVLGLTPMALGLGDGAEIRTPMALAVISGLISSTALTLIVIPTFYEVADRFVSRVLGRERAEEGASTAAPAELSP